MKQSPINDVKLSFTCNENWHEMTSTENGKFCNACQKPVYDLTNENVQTFLQLLAENSDGVCGKFRRAQLSATEDTKPKWQKWFAAAMIAVSFGSLLGCRKEVVAPAPEMETTLESLDNTVMGIIAMPIIEDAHFPGGDQAFQKFIKDNIRYTEEMPKGKVLVTFIVKTDGTLSDIRIARGSTEELNGEILRVLARSPKWIPAYQNNKSYESRYAFPIVFSAKK